MNKLATFSQRQSSKQSIQGVQGVQVNPQDFLQSGDRLEREIASNIDEKAASLNYAHLPFDDKVQRCYKGYFLNYQYLSYPQEIGRATVNGLIAELQAAYFAYEQCVLFWLFEPNEYQKQDMNFYLNPTEQQPFPQNMQQFNFQLDSDITAIQIGRDVSAYFHIGEDLIMTIATLFSVFLYRISYSDGQIQDIVSLNYQINTNGERINNMIILSDSLLLGGSSGQTRRVFWDSATFSTGVGFLETFSKHVKKLFLPQITERVIQIEVDKLRELGYILVQNRDRNAIQVIDLMNNSNRIILTIRQQDISERLQTQIEIANIQKVQSQTSHFLIITTQGHFVTIQLGESQINNTSRPNGTWDIRIFKQANTAVQNVYTIVAEDQQNTLLRPLGNNLSIQSAYCDESVLVLQSMNILQFNFVDMGHVAFERQLTSTMFSNQAREALNYSIYKNSSQSVNEVLILDEQIDQQHQNIQEKTQVMQINRKSNELQSLCSIESKEIYQNLNIIVTLTNQGVYFTLKLRPVDLMFMALKVTHLDLIDRNDSQFPLQALAHSFGSHGAGALVIQILSQPDEQFYIACDLEENFMDRIQEVVKRTERILFSDKYNGFNEDRPIWVIGKAYVLRGNHVTAKARRFLQILGKKERPIETTSDWFYDSDNQPNHTTQRVGSLLIYGRKILQPIYDKQLFDAELKSTFKKDTIDIIYNEVEKLITFLQTEYRLDTKTKQGTQKNQYQLEDQEPKLEQTKRERSRLPGFNYQTFQQFGLPEQMQRITYGVEEAGEIQQEQTQLLQIYNFFSQTAQFLKLFIKLTTEGSLANLLGTLQIDDQRQLQRISISSLFEINSPHLLVLKYVLNQYAKLKSDKTLELHKQYSWFFDELDFKVTFLLNKIESIIIRLMDEKIIVCEEHSISHKIKKILKLTQINPHQNQLKTLYQQENVFIQEKQIPHKEFIIDIKILLNELASYINHTQFTRTFKDPLRVLGMQSSYINVLIKRCYTLSLQISSNSQNILFTKNQHKNNRIQEIRREFLDCENTLVTEIGQLIDQNTTIETMNEIIDSLSQFPLSTVHELVVKQLIQKDLIDFVLRLKSQHLSESSFDAPLLRKYQILQQCAVARGDLIKSIEYSLKLSRHSFKDQPEYTFQRIQKELPIKKRLDYVFDAQETLEQLRLQGLNQQGSTAIFKEYSKNAQDTLVILKLQQIVYDFIQYDHQEQLELLVRGLYQFEQLGNFMFDNNIYFAQVLVLDFSEVIGTNIYEKIDMRVIYREMVISTFEQCRNLQISFPSTEFKEQIKYLHQNIINREKYFILELLLEQIEIINYENGITVQWIPKFLNEELLIPQNVIIRAYLVVFVGQSENGDIKEQIFLLVEVTKAIEKFTQDSLNEINSRDLLRVSNMVSNNSLQLYSDQIGKFFKNGLIQQLSQMVEYRTEYTYIQRVKENFENLIRRAQR